MLGAPRVFRPAAVFVCLLVAVAAAAQDKPPVGTAGTLSPEEKAMMDAMIKAGTPGPNHQLLASMARRRSADPSLERMSIVSW